MNRTADPLGALAPGGILDLAVLAERYGSAPALHWRGHTVSYREYVLRTARAAADLAAAGVTANHRVALSGRAGSANLGRDPVGGSLGPAPWPYCCPHAPRRASGIACWNAPAPWSGPRADRAVTSRNRLRQPHQAHPSRPPYPPRRAGPTAGGVGPRRLHSRRPTRAPDPGCPWRLRQRCASPSIARLPWCLPPARPGQPRRWCTAPPTTCTTPPARRPTSRCGPDDAWLVALPLSHVAGLSILFRTLSAGSCALFADGGSLRDADDPAARLLPDATHVSLVETQLRRLLRISGLAGADAAPARRPGRWQRAVRPTAAPGARRRPAGVRLLRLHRDGVADRHHPAGRPCRDLRRQPRPCCRTGKSRSAPTVKSCSGGRTLCLGYLEQDHVRPAAGAGGWFASGDLGRLDGDRLSVTGRRDARFISGGENIQPEEVERALLEHRAVLAAVCVAVPDREFGRRPAAFLAVDSGPLPPPDIESHLATRLARFKHPVRYFALPAVPSAPAGGASGAAIKHSRSVLAAHAARVISGSR